MVTVIFVEDLVLYHAVLQVAPRADRRLDHGIDGGLIASLPVSLEV
jgi:hypothetical protein